jgi:DNA topoisomerase-1
MIVPIQKASYKIDDSHDMIFTKNGPVIRDNGSSSLKSVNRDIKIDVERLKAGEYTLSELAHQGSRTIGVWDGKELCIHNGRYGIYAQWGDSKKSLSHISKPFAEIEIGDVTAHLQKTQTNANVLRVLNEEFSVRTGKYGPYVYYKRADMAKPEFYNIKKFKESFTYCEPDVLIQWVRKTHNISG